MNVTLRDLDLFLMDEVVLIFKKLLYTILLTPRCFLFFVFPAKGRQLRCKVGGNTL